MKYRERHAALLVAGLVAGCGGGGSPAAPASPPANRPPTVDAGIVQQAQGGGSVVLRATASDPDGGTLTFRWTQTGGPAVALNASGLGAAFVAPMANVTLEFEFRATDPAGLFATDATSVIVSSGFTPCTPTAPPAFLGLDPFYKKYCDANGIPIVSSELVPDRALEWARYVVLEMLKFRPDAAAAIVQQRVRVAIMAETEVTTDIPEHRDLYQAFPGIDWDTRARGLGATPARPATSAAEENVLCYANDRYRNENILIHEFGHTLDEMGIRRSDPGWVLRLTTAYNAAMASGLWVNTYAATNREEYYAEGVQSWFDANQQSNPPDGVHNHVNTRAELAVYDPTLLQLLREAVPEISIPLCPP